jgi:hypothetical protein
MSNDNPMNVENPAVAPSLLSVGLGWTFQFLYSTPDAKHRVHAPYFSDKVLFSDAVKDAQDAAQEMSAKVGFYLKGHHARLP